MAQAKTLMAGALLIACASTARAEPTEKVTSEQIVCDLTGDCDLLREFKLARNPAKGAASQNVQTALHPHVAPRPAGRANLAINFVSGSAVLSESGRQLAQTFMEALGSPKLSGKSFMIGGHTDAVGSRAYNLNLSLRRAQALVDYLVGQGATRSRFEVRGFGFDRPLPGTSRSAAANRRVEVVTRN